MPATLPEAPPRVAPPSVPRRRGWALAALALAAALAAWPKARREPPALARWTAAQLETRVAQFLSGIPRVGDDLKLVVATVETTQAARAESRKSLFGLDLGTTRVAVTVPVRIHYAVDLGRPGAVEFRAEGQRGRLVAVFPEPEVHAVELMLHERRTVVEPGWARLKERSGRSLEGEIERGLYPAVRREASTPAAVAAIKARARGALARLLSAHLRRSGDLVPGGPLREVSIRFRGDLDDDDTAWAH